MFAARISDLSTIDKGVPFRQAAGSIDQAEAMEMQCPTCPNVTTHSHEGRPAPCDGCRRGFDAIKEATEQSRTLRSRMTPEQRMATVMRHLARRKKKPQPPSS